MLIVETTLASAYCIAKTTAAKLLSYAIVGGTKAVTTAVATGCAATTAGYFLYGTITVVMVSGVLIIKIVSNKNGIEISEELKISSSLQNYINNLPAEKVCIIENIKEWLTFQRDPLAQKEAIRALLFIDYIIHPYNGNVDRNPELSETDENKWVCCICYDEYDPKDIITYEPCNHARLCFKCDLINNLTRIQKSYIRQDVILPRCPLDRIIIDNRYNSL